MRKFSESVGSLPSLLRASTSDALVRNTGGDSLPDPRLVRKLRWGDFSNRDEVGSSETASAFLSLLSNGFFRHSDVRFSSATELFTAENGFYYLKKEKPSNIKNKKTKKNIKIVNTKEKTTTFQRLDRKTQDKVLQIFYVPRSRTDLSLRRSRLIDYIEKLLQRGLLQSFLGYIKDPFDYIFVTNLSIVFCIFGEEWFKKMQTTGCFDSTLDHYLKTTKKFSDLIKTRGLDDTFWTYYVEAQVLSGYRNLPFPGFDPLAETLKIAESGVVHDYGPLCFKEIVSKALAMPFKPKQFESFEQFIERGKWATAGASSEGKLEVTVDGQKAVFRCRKNTVLDTIDVIQLTHAAKSNTKQINYTIIKCELGKLRLAVAGDLYTYLQMTWLLDLLNSSYLDWRGVTMDEDSNTQTLRMQRMLELVAASYGLPYDFAAFDHQPTTQELLDILTFIFSHARLNVPDFYLPDFDQIVSLVISAFSAAVLEYRPDHASFSVKGGLMSGLRITSLVGNAWNACMTELVFSLLSLIGFDSHTATRYIRGDDSAIFTPSASLAIATERMYAAVGIEGGVGKFSVQLNAMEFLRVWYSDRCYGYPLRALPGLSQRKPWTPQPWTGDMTIRAMYETISTLRRRAPTQLREIDMLWDYQARLWCRSHGLPRCCLSVPIHSGGYGFEQKQCPKVERIVPAVPARPTFQLEAKILPWRELRLLDRLSVYSLPPDGEKVKEQAHLDFVSTITSDDIPSVSSVLRANWKKEIRQIYKVISLDVTPMSAPNSFFSNLDTAEALISLDELLISRAPFFGKYPYLSTIRDDFALLSTDLTFKQFLKMYQPEILNDVLKFHRSWHLSEVFDFLEGKLSFPTYSCHPSFRKFVRTVIVSGINIRQPTVRHSIAYKAWSAEESLTRTTVYKNLFQW